MNKKFFIFCLSSLLFLNFGIASWFTVAARCSNGSLGEDHFLSEKDGSGSVRVEGQKNFSNLIGGKVSKEFDNNEVSGVDWSYKITGASILVSFSYEGETYITDIDFNPESMSESVCASKSFFSSTQEAYDPSNRVKVSVNMESDYYFGLMGEESLWSTLIIIDSEGDGGDGFSILLYEEERSRY